MIIGIDFSESVFMHAILMVHDHIEPFLHFAQGTSDLPKFFRNYEIYIGDSDDYSQN